MDSTRFSPPEQDHLDAPPDAGASQTVLVLPDRPSAEAAAEAIPGAAGALSLEEALDDPARLAEQVEGLEVLVALPGGAPDPLRRQAARVLDLVGPSAAHARAVEWAGWSAGTPYRPPDPKVTPALTHLVCLPDADLEAVGGGGPAARPRDQPDAGRRQGAADRLATLALELCELVVAPDGTTYVRIPIESHIETYPVRGPAFRRWLRHAYFLETRRPVSAEALATVVETVDAHATFNGRRAEVRLRLAADPARPPADPVYYLDLCDFEWRAVEITRAGWRIVKDPPVLFARRAGSLALPEPTRGGSLTQLRDYINVGSDDDFLLVAAWLTAALRPEGPYPVLSLTGEQGSAKSTTARVLRRLVDPHVTLLRSEPKEVRDLAIAATGCWVVALDNLSGLWPWLSDALCRLSTGAGFATRALYTDQEEIHFNACRPILLNGIADCGSRPDLLDRSIVLDLPRVAEQHRREEGPFWRAFEAAAPALLGALLDAVAGGLRELPAVCLERLPRLADFARWGEAVARALGHPAGTFLAAYDRNRRAGIEVALEAFPVAQAINDFLAGRAAGDWEGSPAELLAELAKVAGEQATRGRGWPKSPRGLAGCLKVLAPVLRANKIEVERGPRLGNRRTLILRLDLGPEKRGEKPSLTESPSLRIANT
jgi:hypothetical protein